MLSYAINKDTTYHVLHVHIETDCLQHTSTHEFNQSPWKPLLLFLLLDIGNTHAVGSRS